ncbi:hypothetical protein HNR23_002955 [Nocardiopsis mwathae]|uniref:Uncharacterized protein n=1 Tax=Nocardiopsis mwathae TaxID=1472723 RepID=A0A7X0D652_9ACTN|nr:hypothetical protein [Nocardiopsis mwathae]MBB6172895.1 hypothetical protein [Nocardiopsis mwathae]
MNHSRSLIALVEKGHRIATSAFIAAASSALIIDPAETSGQPYRGDPATADKVHATIPDLRPALACTDLPPGLDGPPRALHELAAEIERLRRYSLNAKYLRVGTRISAVLTELAAHVHDTGSPRAWRLIDSAQALAVALARRLGYNDLAAGAIRDAADAAENSDDPRLPRLAKLSRALLMMTIGAWTSG